MDSTGPIIYKCCIKNCPSVRRKGGIKKCPVKFYRFSRKLEIVAQSWILNCRNYINGDFKKSSKICSLHFTTEQFTSSLRTQIRQYGIPTIFPKICDTNDNPFKSSSEDSLDRPEESLKVLNSLIKQLEDTNAALNQVFKVDLHDHIKKEADEGTILSLEDVSVDENITNYDPHSTSKKNINKPTIFTYEEITAEDIRNVDEILYHEHNETLNNTFKENFSSLNADEDIKYEIYKDKENIKSIQEEMEKELEDEDIKLEIIDNNEKYMNVKKEFQIWNAQDYRYLDNVLREKEIESEDLFVEVGIKKETISDEDDIDCTNLPRNNEDTYGKLSFLTHQISKRNDIITSKSEIGRSFPLVGVRKVNDRGKEINYHSSPHCKVSNPKNVSSGNQETANVKTVKSFERTKYDGNQSLSARNDEKDYIVSKRNSECSETSSDPNKKCLIVPVQNSRVCIKLKPFKRKMKC